MFEYIEAIKAIEENLGLCLLFNYERLPEMWIDLFYVVFEMKGGHIEKIHKVKYFYIYNQRISS